MDSINAHPQAHAASSTFSEKPQQLPTVEPRDIDEDDAVRKVEEANTPSKDAQDGVRELEAVTLTWTKTSLVAAFIWQVNVRYVELH